MQIPGYITIMRNFDLFGTDPQTKYHTSDCNCVKFSADSLGNDTLEDIKGEIIHLLFNLSQLKWKNLLQSAIKRI